MKREVAVMGVLLAVLVTGGLIYREYYQVESVTKPKLWGLSDPPTLANMSWEREGQVDILKVESQTAPQLYGEVLEELQDLGYAMLEGNWSRTECQWSLWEKKGGKSYYLAYNGTRFLAIRGPSEGVLNASAKEWLCGRPSGSSIVVAPSPWKAAELLALSLGKELIERNISIAPANWSGTLPDWYLAKFSFRAEVGDGVDVLILVYSKEDQVKYAEHLLKKEDKLRFLESDAGQYRALIVFRGRKTDVERLLSSLAKTIGKP